MEFMRFVGPYISFGLETGADLGFRVWGFLSVAFGTGLGVVRRTG